MIHGIPGKEGCVNDLEPEKSKGVASNVQRKRDPYESLNRIDASSRRVGLRKVGVRAWKG